jgi:alpha-ribazole phosphatase
VPLPMNECTRIDLLRHGECEGGPIFRGHNDVCLTPAGFTQMQKALARAAPWSCIISSPLKRCREFVESLAEVEVVFDARLREMSFGHWDGRPVEEIWQTDPATISAWSRDPTSVTPPGGETLVRVAERVMACFTDLVTQQRGQKLLLVTHGGVIRVLISQLLGMPLSHAGRVHVPYAALTSVAVYHQVEGDLVKLLGHNWACEEMDHG